MPLGVLGRARAVLAPWEVPERVLLGVLERPRAVLAPREVPERAGRANRGARWEPPLEESPAPSCLCLEEAAAAAARGLSRRRGQVGLPRRHRTMRPHRSPRSGRPTPRTSR